MRKREQTTTFNARRALVAVAALTALCLPSAASATTVTLGTPTAGFGANSTTSCGRCAMTQLEAPALQLAAPGDGMLTTWRINGNGQMALRILRPAGGNRFTAAGTHAPFFIWQGVQTFTTSLPIRAGDHIGLDLQQGASLVTANNGAGTIGQAFGPIPDESTGDFSSNQSGLMSLNADVVLAPVVTGVSPAVGPTAGGTKVTITGQYLDGATGVAFGTVGASFEAVSDTQLVATAPAQDKAGIVDVRVTGPGGQSSVSAADQFNYGGTAAAGGGGAAGAPGAGSTPGSGDATAPAGVRYPVLSILRLSTSRFLAAPTGGAITAAAIGTTVRYSVSRRSNVRFRIQRWTGRRYVTLRSSFVRRGAEGQDSFRFTGRLGGRALRPGRYRFAAVATDAAGKHSPAQRHLFRVLG